MALAASAVKCSIFHLYNFYVCAGPWACGVPSLSPCWTMPARVSWTAVSDRAKIYQEFEFFFYNGVCVVLPLCPALHSNSMYLLRLRMRTQIQLLSLLVGFFFRPFPPPCHCLQSYASRFLKGGRRFGRCLADQQQPPRRSRKR